MWPGVLVLVQFNNFYRNTGFYWCYMLLLKPPILMHSWHTYMWKSHIEIKGYSVAYFNRIAMFEVPYRWTSVKGGAHTCFVDVWISNKSTKRIWVPLLTTVQRYSALKAAKWSKYATEWPLISTWDCLTYKHNLRLRPHQHLPHPHDYVPHAKESSAMTHGFSVVKMDN